MALLLRRSGIALVNRQVTSLVSSDSGMHPAPTPTANTHSSHVWERTWKKALTGVIMMTSCNHKYFLSWVAWDVSMSHLQHPALTSQHSLDF